MKFLKKIVALISAATIFGLSAMAADFKFSDVSYTTGDETISVSFYANDNVLSMEGGSSVYIKYNTDLTYNKSLSTAYSSDIELIDDQQTPGQVGLNIKNDILDIDTTKAICTLVFTVNGDPTGYEFKTKNITIYDVTADCDRDTTDVSVTVKTTGSSELTPYDTTDAVELDATTKKSYQTVVDTNKKTRYVAIQTLEDLTVDANSVLKATYDGTTRARNLATMIGMESDSTGIAEITKFVVKMILPDTVTTAPAANAFSFVIE